MHFPSPSSLLLSLLPIPFSLLLLVPLHHPAPLPCFFFLWFLSFLFFSLHISFSFWVVFFLSPSLSLFLFPLLGVSSSSLTIFLSLPHSLFPLLSFLLPSAPPSLFPFFLLPSLANLPLPLINHTLSSALHILLPGFFLEYNFRGGKSTFLEIEGGILIKNLRGKTIFRGGKTIFRGGKMPPLKALKKPCKYLNLVWATSICLCPPR